MGHSFNDTKENYMLTKLQITKYHASN